MIAAFVILAHLAAQTPALRQRMFAAEDARAQTTTEMAPLLEGLRAADAKDVARAVRALGRFERPGLVKTILPLAAHARPEVRAEAFTALGQSLAAVPRAVEGDAPMPAEAALVTETLLARLRTEPDPFVLGVIAETLGRQPFRSAETLQQVERALAALLPAAGGASASPAEGEPIGRVMHPASIAGAVKGLETRIRVYQKRHPVAPEVVARLRSAAVLGSDPSDADFAFIRRLSWQALNGATAADAALTERGLEDPDPQVRRHATLSIGYLVDSSISLLTRALRDPSFMVRYDAVRIYSRTRQTIDCAPLLAAIDDANPHVSLAAIDVLGNGCPGGPNPAARLAAIADEIENAGSGSGWHGAVHALLSLARVSRDEAARRLERFGTHPVWQVRMYAARAAAELKAGARLERLAADDHDNVREAALAGLVAVRGREADEHLIAALARRDYQLVLTAATALKGTADAERAVPALLSAFARISAEGRDTSRDPRMAILDRLQEVGGKPHAAALQPCLGDADPAVARRCAAVLQAWTGTPHVARPARPRTVQAALPTERRARITMRRGGAFELQFFPDEAPATVARVARLARAGYYNGLTFHRVVPNFVIQGGSPGANEYVGDGPYMRDEVGMRSHTRGTLGISTRGRDTGDAQIFVNLADNPRLDHQYTVFAEVTRGMDVVDGILEGDVIERVEVLEPAATASGR